MKRGKDLCCMFLLAVFRVDPAQNVAKYKKELRACAHTTHH